MKRFAATILAVLYLVTSAGATMQLHYCMDRLVDWSMNAQEPATCGHCGMEKEAGKDDGCCKYEHKFFKANPDQNTVENGFGLMIFTTALPAPFTIFPTECHLIAAYRKAAPAHAPPRESAIPVYILHNSFLI